jgi:predicted house-cleaning noncanonical NTP pyrophosphatase (MazG superfamily)
VLELYWPQVRGYRLPAGRAVVLRQSSQPRAVTVDAVRRLRTHARTHARTVRETTPASAERLLLREYGDALDTIELNLVQMPLGNLHRPLGFSEAAGRGYPRFLYREALLVKLYEEPAELAAAEETEVLDELADVYEVLRAIAEQSGVNLAQVSERADAKGVEQGRLRERLYLVRVASGGDGDKGSSTTTGVSTEC